MDVAKFQENLFQRGEPWICEALRTVEELEQLLLLEESDTSGLGVKLAERVIVDKLCCIEEEAIGRT